MSIGIAIGAPFILLAFNMDKVSVYWGWLREAIRKAMQLVSKHRRSIVRYLVPVLAAAIVVAIILSVIWTSTLASVVKVAVTVSVLVTILILALITLAFWFANATANKDAEPTESSSGYESSIRHSVFSSSDDTNATGSSIHAMDTLQDAPSRVQSTSK